MQGRGAVVPDDNLPGVLSICESCWPSLDGKRRCTSGLVNCLTSALKSSGLSCLAPIRKRQDPEDPNLACEKPPILEDMQPAAIDDADQAGWGGCRPDLTASQCAKVVVFTATE